MSLTLDLHAPDRSQDPDRSAPDTSRDLVPDGIGAEAHSAVFRSTPGHVGPDYVRDLLIQAQGVVDPETIQAAEGPAADVFPELDTATGSQEPGPFAGTDEPVPDSAVTRTDPQAAAQSHDPDAVRAAFDAEFGSVERLSADPAARFRLDGYLAGQSPTDIDSLIGSFSDSQLSDLLSATHGPSTLYYDTELTSSLTDRLAVTLSPEQLVRVAAAFRSAEADAPAPGNAVAFGEAVGRSRNAVAFATAAFADPSRESAPALAGVLSTLPVGELQAVLQQAQREFSTAPAGSLRADAPVHEVLVDAVQFSVDTVTAPEAGQRRDAVGELDRSTFDALAGRLEQAANGLTDPTLATRVRAAVAVGAMLAETDHADRLGSEGFGETAQRLLTAHPEVLTEMRHFSDPEGTGLVSHMRRAFERGDEESVGEIIAAYHGTQPPGETVSSWIEAADSPVPNDLNYLGQSVLGALRDMEADYAGQAQILVSVTAGFTRSTNMLPLVGSAIDMAAGSFARSGAEQLSADNDVILDRLRDIIIPRLEPGQPNGNLPYNREGFFEPIRDDWAEVLSR